MPFLELRAAMKTKRAEPGFPCTELTPTRVSVMAVKPFVRLIRRWTTGPFVLTNLAKIPGPSPSVP